ncbi:MAG: hypothetical protein AAGF11_02905, partial [Myxococcota bacterium]
MATNEMAMTPMGMAMLVSTTAEDSVACPHCGESIVLETVEAEPGCLATACPHCGERSLLVRLVSILHRAVKWPAELLAGSDESEADAASAKLRTPDGIYGLPVSRGAVALLAMLWRQAEQAGSRVVEGSVARLARQQQSSRGSVRRWMTELVEAKALQEIKTE